MTNGFQIHLPRGKRVGVFMRSGIKKQGGQRCGEHEERGNGTSPGGPVAKTLHSQCRAPGFNPWSGN